MKTKSSSAVLLALLALLAIGCKSNSERNWDNAKDAAKEAGEAAKDAASSAAEAVKDAAGEVRDKVTK